MMSDLNVPLGKMSDFVSFPLFEFILAIRLRNFDFKSLNWNTLLFLNKKDMASDLNMSHGEMSGFVLSPLFGFTLVIKSRNSDFECDWNVLILFHKKDIRFDYFLSKSVWFGLSFVVGV